MFSAEEVSSVVGRIVELLLQAPREEFGKIGFAAAVSVDFAPRTVA